MPAADFDRSLKVLVLAGADPAPERTPPRANRRETPLEDKAFRPLRDRLVVEYALDVLREYGFSRIWLLGPEHLLARIPPPHRFTPVAQRSGAGLFANLTAGAAAMDVEADEAVLAVFGDHPLNSVAALEAFLAGCRESRDQADFFHALALRDSYREFGGSFDRTSVHMREMCGRASGFTLAIPSRLHHLHRLDDLYGVRKLERIGSFARLLTQLARTLGSDAPRAIVDSLVLWFAKEMEKGTRRSGTAARIARKLESWAAARVPASRLMRYTARILGAERGARLIPVAHGGMAVDVDFAEDLEAIESRWDELRAISSRQDAALRHHDLRPRKLSDRMSRQIAP